MTTYRSLASELAGVATPSFLTRLAESPVSSLASIGIRVESFDGQIYASGDCSCDGIFHPGPPAAIGYRPTPSSRRQRFTLIHEFGHYSVRKNDSVLSSLADMGDDGGRQAEERVCDALAGLVLIPDSTVDSLLNGDRPLAQHVAELYDRSHGSREACAVRLAERLPAFGYVVIGDPDSKTIRFASPSPTNQYPWHRESKLPDSHAIWRAVDAGQYRGQGPVIWPSGQARELWIDAVAHGREVHAVFTEHRHWKASGLSVLDGGVRQARGTAYSGTCRRCNKATWGYRLHEQCGELWCKHCGKCGCGTPSRPEPKTWACIRCGLTKRSGLFPNDGNVCVDC